jgi:hypothetical protein
MGSGALLRLSPFVLVADTTDQLGLFFAENDHWICNKLFINQLCLRELPFECLDDKGRHYNDTEIFVHDMNGFSTRRAL